MTPSISRLLSRFTYLNVIGDRVCQQCANRFFSDHFDFVPGVASSDAVSSSGTDEALDAASLKTFFINMIRDLQCGPPWAAHLWNENPNPGYVGSRSRVLTANEKPTAFGDGGTRIRNVVFPEKC
ncbi:hypothetical protein [Mycolicibacterium septicum]|uniref:hypothetical protein n=1 Tax=Mycolicibacterium septicum TaxID=98668 RepID=UPI0023624D78|nr:hypothetical protein [Mycolicibacterium septicum]